MTAGRGIVHSERSPAEQMAKGAAMFGLQTWLALPDALEDTAPAFENVGCDRLPMIADGSVSARVIIGSLWGQSAPTTCHSPTIYADLKLGAGGSIPIDSEADERAVMLVDGDAALDGMPLERYGLYLIAPGARPRLASITGGRAMLMGGAAFGSARHIWWNFVGSTNGRIRDAADRWNKGEFPKVPGDEKEFIPIPVVPLTQGRM